MADVSNQSPKFMDFLFIGLDHGIDSISDSGGPLIPLLMTQTGDKKDLKRFVTEKYEDGIASAEQSLGNLSPTPDFALIAFDGFITWEEKKYDAILVRAFDKTQDEGFTFCQRYISKSDGEGIEPIGNSAFIGKEPNLLTFNSDTIHEEKKSRKPWWKF